MNPVAEKDIAVNAWLIIKVWASFQLVIFLIILNELMIGRLPGSLPFKKGNFGWLVNWRIGGFGNWIISSEKNGG